MNIDLHAAEEKVEALARDIAKRRGSPAGAGEIGLILGAVREACDAARSDLMLVLADAWKLYIVDQDDLDGFVRTMTEQMPKDWWTALTAAQEMSSDPG
jgi:hypothetical protein